MTSDFLSKITLSDLTVHMLELYCFEEKEGAQ